MKIWDKANWDEMQVEKESFIMFWDKTWDNEDETRQEMGQEKREEEKVQEGKRRDEMHTQNHILSSPSRSQFQFNVLYWHDK